MASNLQLQQLSFSNYNCVVFKHKVMAKERKMQSNCSLAYVQALSCFFFLKTNTSEAYRSVQNRSTFLNMGKTLAKHCALFLRTRVCILLDRPHSHNNCDTFLMPL